MSPRTPSVHPLRLAANLALVTLILVGAARAVRALAQFPTAAAAGLASVPRGEDRNLPLDLVTASDPRNGTAIDLAAIRRGALFVYDPECGPCSANLWNWTEMARDLPLDVNLISLTLRGRASDADYWAPFPRVRVAETDSATMRDVLRAPSTPTTLVVIDGRVRRSYRGPLTAAMRADIAARLSR